jgi:archaellum component FlaG (FlaF/FlaG flagellin family)
MTMQKATIGAVAAIAFTCLMVSALGALVATQTISSTGTITAVGVGVYSNSGCTTVLSTINWGNINPGNVTTYTMYVKNTGDTSATLNMTTNSWSPSSAASYIKLTWNQEKTVLTAGQVVTAVLTLSVSSSISNVTSFSFNIIITGTH